jgi:hypothetical protein
MPDEPLDEYLARLTRYSQARDKQIIRAIENIPDCAKPADGIKRLTNTGHDKELANRLTIHDKMASNPAYYAELKRIFG